MGAIYRKELRGFFSNMTGYIFIAFVLVVVGLFTTAANFKGGYPYFEYALSSVSFIFLLAVPILTMRVFAEEKHARTDQLLYTLPISTPQVVLGKFFAMVTVFLIPVGVMCLYPLILVMYGTTSVTTAYSAIIGFLCLGSALISIGMFISSLTESQVIAAVVSFGALLITYLMTGLASLVPSTASASYIAFAIAILVIALIIYTMTKNYWVAFTCAAVGEVALTIFYFVNGNAFVGAFASVLSSLSLFDRLNNFIYGVFDITAVVYYLSVIAVFVFFTVQSIEKRRWS